MHTSPAGFMGTRRPSEWEASIEDIYSPDAVSHASTRLERLRAAFIQRFGAAPEVVFRAPGRVNLIGEHVDYEGYNVFPMAISQDVMVAIRAVDKPVSPGRRSAASVANINPELYPDVELEDVESKEVDPAAHSWANYVLCGIKGFYEFMDEAGEQPPSQRALELMVDGEVPVAAGLSSSSALVCASLGAVMAVYGLDFDKVKMAEAACKCERYVGTQGGGMDQAISILAQRGFAQLVNFSPLSTTSVPLPKGGTFCVAKSLVSACKAGIAASHFNLRVIECRLAAAVLASSLGMLSNTNIHDIETLRDFEQLVGDTSTAAALVGKHLNDLLTAPQVESIIGCTLESLFGGNANLMTALRAIPPAYAFKLHSRATHVFTEALRVRDFQQISLRASAGSASQTASSLLALGDLMNASHASCRDLYECSCSDLDTLVAVCKHGQDGQKQKRGSKVRTYLAATLAKLGDSGALGARLTGAGWGGCVVALVADSSLEKFICSVEDAYYANNSKDGQMHFFSSKPGSGAAVIRNRSR